MNKEIDWHGPRHEYTRTYSYRIGEGGGVDKGYLDNRLVYVAAGEGAWPKAIFPEPVCGWAERDALV